MLKIILCTLQWSSRMFPQYFYVVPEINLKLDQIYLFIYRIIYRIDLFIE